MNSEQKSKYKPTALWHRWNYWKRQRELCDCHRCKCVCSYICGNRKVHLGACLQLGIQACDQSEYVALQFTKTTCPVYTHYPSFSHSLCFFHYIFLCLYILWQVFFFLYTLPTDTHAFFIIETDAVPYAIIGRWLNMWLNECYYSIVHSTAPHLDDIPSSRCTKLLPVLFS